MAVRNKIFARFDVYISQNNITDTVIVSNQIGEIIDDTWL